MKNLKRKIGIIICMVIMSTCFVVAQTNTIKHTVERGETLASIAKQYSTTEDKIIELNPDAVQFVYVGMELIIPVAQEREQVSETIVYTTDSSNVVESSTKETSLQTRDNEYNAGDFSSFGIFYVSDFDNAGRGYYMLGGEVFSDSGWGMDFHMGFNYGLVDSDYAGYLFLIGPAYGYVYNNILVSTSLDFIGTYSGTGESEKTKTNAKGEEYSYIGTDSKFNWGLALMPKVGIKLGHVIPWLGINAQWAKGANKLSLGFQIGITFDNIL